MFAIVRTGGKQYRVAPGDKIVVEKLAGEAGDRVDITDVLLAGEGSNLLATAGLIVGAEIVGQAKSDKVTVFKKRRRHNYRRKAGHRQQLTILKIVSIGDKKAEKKAPAKPVPSKVEGEAAPAKTETAPAKAETAPVKADKPAAAPKAEKPKPVPNKAEGAEAKPAKAETAKASTKDAAPAKAAPKKAAPKAAAKTEKK